MKSGLLLISTLAVSAHFGFAQNVKIIRASERSAVKNTVIIPAPTQPFKSAAADTAKKISPVPAAASASQKKPNVKPVRGTSTKKPSVKKVYPAPVRTARPKNGNVIESVKK